MRMMDIDHGTGFENIIENGEDLIHHFTGVLVTRMKFLETVNDDEFGFDDIEDMMEIRDILSRTQHVQPGLAVFGMEDHEITTEVHFRFKEILHPALPLGKGHVILEEQHTRLDRGTTQEGHPLSHRQGNLEGQEGFALLGRAYELDLARDRKSVV